MGQVNEDPKYQPDEPPKPIGLADDVIISSDTHRENRIPPGQSRTRKWPVLHASTVPKVNLETWTLQITGLVDNPLSFNLEQFRSLPRVKVFSDFHCVTQWSRLGNLWEGVSVLEIANRAGVQSAAKFVLPTGYDFGWSTNLPIEEFLLEDAIFADTHDGEPIDADHGGPVRLVIPKLYAWKSAKWVKEVQFTEQDSPGYWEQGGYHNHGDPWTEERFQHSENIPPGF